MNAPSDKDKSKILFLHLIGKETCVPHKDRVHVYHSERKKFPLVKCTVCDWTCDVYATTEQPSEEDLFKSCRIAEAFAHWRGDVECPVPVTLHQLPGIVPEPIVVPLKTVLNAVQLFGRMNAPFTITDDNPLSKKRHYKILTHFLEDLSSKINAAATQQQQSEEDEGTINGTQCMLQLLDVIQSKLRFGNDDTGQMLFKEYEDNIVPYVLSCTDDPRPTLMAIDENAPLTKQLYLHIGNSSLVRRAYGKYSILFEIFHVMVTCYACMTNTRVTANLTFDAVARIARGEHFHVEKQFCQKSMSILTQYAGRRSNTELYYVLRGLQQSHQPEDLYCEEFFEKYRKLARLVHKHLGSSTTDFPEVLFKTNGNYLGFMLAMSQVMFASGYGKVSLPKGTIATAKRVHRMIRSFVEQLQEFERGGNEVFWTFETFYAFLASNDGLNEHVMELIETFSMDSGSKKESSATPPTKRSRKISKPSKGRMFGGVLGEASKVVGREEKIMFEGVSKDQSVDYEEMNWE